MNCYHFLKKAIKDGTIAEEVEQMIHEKDERWLRIVLNCRNMPKEVKDKVQAYFLMDELVKW